MGVEVWVKWEEPSWEGGVLGKGVGLVGAHPFEKAHWGELGREVGLAVALPTSSAPPSTLNPTPKSFTGNGTNHMLKVFLHYLILLGENWPQKQVKNPPTWPWGSNVRMAAAQR